MMNYYEEQLERLNKDVASWRRTATGWLLLWIASVSIIVLLFVIIHNQRADIERLTQFSINDEKSQVNELRNLERRLSNCINLRDTL